MQATDQRVDTKVWAFEQTDPSYLEGEVANVEIERTEPNEVALHTFIDGTGSHISLYWTREQAIEIARLLLNEAKLR